MGIQSDKPRFRSSSARRAFRATVATMVTLLVTSLLSPALSHADQTYAETTGGVANTWTNYTNAGGTGGAQIGSNQTVQIACKVTGFRVADGNTWWYRIAQSPWNNQFYVSADAFYNNGATSGSLHGTPFVDPAVPDCSSLPSGNNETTGGVANTWTDYTSAGGSAGPQIGANQTVVIACKLTGFRVADGNTWWYRIASAPWSGNYYVSADAFYNNGATSGSLIGTPFVDPAVPDCAGSAGGDTGGGKPAPSVTLAQGPAAQYGYRYAITLNNFAPNVSVDVVCFDSVSPNGFLTLKLTTNSSGSASIVDKSCYSGEGADHWVIAGGVESNHVSWGPGSGSAGGGTGGSGGSTGGTGGSTASASCNPPGGSVTTATAYPSDKRSRQPRNNANRVTDLALQAEAQAGIIAKAGPVSFALLQHYLGASGSDYTIGINELMADQNPLFLSFLHYLRLNSASALSELKATPPNTCASKSISSGWVGYVVTNKDDWYYALRSFGYQLAGTMWIGQSDSAGNRPIVVTYRAFVADTYNFNPNDPKFGKFERLAIDGWAADFKVFGQTTTFTARGSTNTFDPLSLGIPVP